MWKRAWPVILMLCVTARPAWPADRGSRTSGLTRFIPTDTSRLMGSPDPLPPLDIEPAFEHLKFDRPVQPTHAGDGTNRLFIVTQPGRIYVFPNTPQAREAELFLDLSKVVRAGLGDNGMFALAFHPKYRDNGQLFVVYTARTHPMSSIVARFRVSQSNPNRADRDSQENLFQITQPLPDHNAACVQFGPDGYLYISLGDGGYHEENGNAQDVSTLLGSMLRIDVDRTDPGLPYAIPKDNPFVDRPGARGEIWAYGLRAPWRFSFDRVTGDCWLGDNGQSLYEEIDLITRGGNYGWIEREGLHAFDPNTVAINAQRKKMRIEGELPPLRPQNAPEPTFVDPVLEYPHTEGKSVVGGFVYRGKRLPQLIGAYLYADYEIGRIWALRWDGKQVTENKLIAETRRKITSFGEDEAGELYFTCFDGLVYRLRPAPATESPTAFPTRISETGLFASATDLTPAPGLIPYSVNVPLWSDQAAKERYIALPQKGTVIFHEDTPWEFPVGTVFVKTFFLHLNRGRAQSRKRLETRLLVHNPRGWDGYTYRWNDAETEAYLLGGSATETYNAQTESGPVRQEWYFPSRTDCRACHPQSAGYVLGGNTRQMNRGHVYPNGAGLANQLRMLDQIGVFAERLPAEPERLPAFPDWETGEGSTDRRARAYLHANCAMCHTPPGYTKIDLRFQTALDKMNLVGEEPEKPRVGPSDSRLIAVGDPRRSELYLRMNRRGPGQMPNLATSRIDERANRLIADWIRSLPEKRRP